MASKGGHHSKRGDTRQIQTHSWLGQDVTDPWPDLWPGFLKQDIGPVLVLIIVPIIIQATAQGHSSPNSPLSRSPTAPLFALRIAFCHDWLLFLLQYAIKRLCVNW